MRVFDAFMFNNELDVLELRLAELASVVDRFVLVEAAETHSARPKPLHFEANRHRFQRYLDRIEHVKVECFANLTDAWARENSQREAIRLGLQDLADDDFVIISDVDEIPRPSAIARLRSLPGAAFVGMRLALFYLRFNYLQLRGADPVFVWPVAVRGDVLRRLGPQQVRNMRTALHRAHRLGTLAADQVVLDHAGWHFSYVGDDQSVRDKLASFAHLELARSEALEQHGIDGILSQRLDLFNRPHFQWVAVALNEYFPATLVGAADRYRDLLVSAPEYVNDIAATMAGRVVVLQRAV